MTYDDGTLLWTLTATPAEGGAVLLTSTLEPFDEAEPPVTETLLVEGPLLDGLIRELIHIRNANRTAAAEARQEAEWQEALEQDPGLQFRPSASAPYWLR